MNDSAASKKIIGMAMRLVSAGRFDDAIRALNSENKVALGHPLGLTMLGGIYLELGKFDPALRAFERASKVAPNFPEAHCNRGVTLQKLGRNEEALAALDKALRLRPDYALAHFNRGNVLEALGRFDKAVEAFGNAIKLKPDSAEAFLNRGSAQWRQGNLLAALADADRAIGLRPNSGNAAVLKANVLGELGRLEEALAVLDGAHISGSIEREALLVRSRLLIKGDRHEDALTAAEAALERNEKSAAVHVVRATALWKLGRLDEALAAADLAIELDPNDAECHAIRGHVLGRLQRHDEQIAALDVAIRLAPSDARHFHARGVALMNVGRVTAAHESYQRALELVPNDALIRYDLAMIDLLRGDFERGFAGHEWRIKTEEFSGKKYLDLAPQWNGEDIADRSLLVYPEQGIGDIIQFVRYVDPIVKLGARVSVVAPRPLKHLFALSLPDAKVDSGLGERCEFDYQVSLLSLGHIFRTRLDTIPGSVPYLHADPDSVEKWRGRIGEDGFRIGIVWQGNPDYRGDRSRSVALERFAPLAAIDGVRLISLQAIHGLDQLDNLPAGMTVESLGDEITQNPDGIAEIAAAMACLDLVVTIDSAIAHLAGALARPVWVMVRSQPEWRWMLERSDSPWYPTMRLFRQANRSSWDDVFAAVTQEIEALVATKNRSEPR